MTCAKCGKPTFAGCGAHIEHVLGDVPKEQRCRCAEASASEPGDAKKEASTRGWLDWLRR